MNSYYRWVIVAAGAFMGCVAIGSIFSLPVFLQPISQATGWSRTGISSAMTINFVAMGVTGFGSGIVMDRFGPRIVLLSGGTLLGLGLVPASRASSVLEFQMLYGCLVGGGGGAIFAPLMATVTGWFETRRSLAVSLVSAGMGVAPMTVAPLAAELVSIYDWRTSQGRRPPPTGPLGETDLRDWQAAGAGAVQSWSVLCRDRPRLQGGRCA